MPTPLGIQKALTALSSSLYSIDIRAAVATKGDATLSLLTAIRISSWSVEEVKRRYDKLESKSSRPSRDEFRILFEALPISKLSNVLQGLSEGKLDIEGCRVSFPQPMAADQLYPCAVTSQFNHSIQQWTQTDWPSLYYYPTGNRTVSFQDQKVKESADLLGWPSAESAASYFLEVAERDMSSRQTHLFILLTIPARIKAVASNTSRLEIHVYAEKHLQNLTATWIVEGNNEPPQSLKLDVVEEGETYRHLKGSPMFGRWERNQTLRCSLMSSEFGALDQIAGRLDNLLSLPELNPLYVCLSQFWDMKAFAQRIEKPYKTEAAKIDATPQRVFQRSVADLLGLAGLQAIELGSEEFIKDPNTKFTRCTLDILAYHRAQNILILGACVTDAPKPQDITKILETQAVLSDLFPPDTSVRLIPMIFSAQQQRVRTDREVYIFNTAKLGKLRTLVESGQEQDFLTWLGMPFDDPLDESY